jgi:hypothetical protein
MNKSCIDVKPTREAEFKMQDIFDNQEQHYCKLRITVIEMTYVSGQKYYDISYFYTFSSEDDDSKRAHPFFYNKKFIESDDVNGVIVIKNPMTEEMVNMLLMDVNKFNKCIGHTWWMQYKIKIMESLNTFWD